MQKAYSIKNNTIIINRELTQLDLFVKDFLNVLKKHTDYLIVSGYVSIATGRTRGTEDVDIIIPQLEKSKFEELFIDLQKNKFWCFQGNDPNNVYTYIKNLTNIRFSKANEVFPNIELVPINKSKKAQFFEYTHPQIIKIKDFMFKIPPIEFEILYKEIILGSRKDIADASHLRNFFSDILNEKKFKDYKKIIEGESK